MALNIKPIAGTNNRVFIEPAAAETKTASGIIIPDNAKEKPKKGTVVAIGNDSKDETPTVKVGDTVIYSYGSTINYEGKDYIVMRESDILAII
ncbi:co-chaperone GroES [uncultured Algibacter sp.]|uniref:co-chaperone GroES n=1 Tax=uncultured Algibacter sp. TaxID=298659 RepID=UPI002609181C|nr:co-chaperone GroES [uncultured Algibacter sp.]